MIAVGRGVKGVNVTKMCSYEMWEQLEDIKKCSSLIKTLANAAT